MAVRRAISMFHLVSSPASRLAAEGGSKSAWNAAPDPFLQRKNQNLLPALLQIQRLRSSNPPSSGKISIGPETRSAATGEGEVEEEDHHIVYRGPISSTIKKVKLLSLSTCCLSVSLGPVITFMTSPDMNVILKGAVASTVIFLSASTTAALHWFVSPYVHRLRWRPGADSVDAELITWLATSYWRTVRFADVQPPKTQRPFVTFKAGDSFYFVDGEHFKNKALLARLTPAKSSPFDSALKNL